MAPLLTITTETQALLAAIDRYPALVMKHAKPAAKVTADHIVREARARLRRQLKPGSTGESERNIHAEETHDGSGYVVLPFDTVGPNRQPNLPVWLQFGTQYMSAREYFFSSARLEEAAHDRRMREAIQDAIDEGGLGS